MEPHLWTLRVRTTDSGEATVTTRQHRFTVGAPVEFDDESPRVSALEYVLGALGADLATGFAALARKGGVVVDHVEAVVQGELNDPLSALGVIGAPGHPGIERVRVRVYVSSLEEPSRLQELWAQAQATSPLLGTLRAAFAIDLTMEIAL